MEEVFERTPQKANLEENKETESHVLEHYQPPIGT